MIKKKIIRYLIYIFTKIFTKIILLIPYNFAVIIGGILGRFAYTVLPCSREHALENLKTAFPDKQDNELESIVKEMYVHLGKNFFELVSFPKINKKKLDNLIKSKGCEHIDKALEKGKGAIYFTGHIGNWEFLAAYVALKGYPLTVVAKQIYDERLNEMLIKYRESKGVKVLLRNDSPRQFIRELRANKMMGVLIDQDTNVKGCFVDFFGKPAYTPSGAITIALKYKVPVVVGFINRKKNNLHEIEIEPFHLNDTGDMEKDIESNTQLITNMIETRIRNNPEQWVWVHKRWKTKK